MPKTSPFKFSGLESGLKKKPPKKPKMPKQQAGKQFTPPEVGGTLP